MPPQASPLPQPATKPPLPPGYYDADAQPTQAAKPPLPPGYYDADADQSQQDRPKWAEFAKPGPYKTELPPQDEQKFQSWVKQNKIPFENDTETSDYDMRGFWKAQQAGDPEAKRAANLHFPDTYKTPYHETFSNESKYALPSAGHWEGDTFVPPSSAAAVDELTRQTNREAAAAGVGPKATKPELPKVEGGLAGGFAPSHLAVEAGKGAEELGSAVAAFPGQVAHPLNTLADVGAGMQEQYEKSRQTKGLESFGINSP